MSDSDRRPTQRNSNGTSIDDVARLAGVSRSTVSYVLNDGPRRVRPELAGKVLAAMRTLDYRPSRIARTMVTGRSGVIGVIHAPFKYEGHGGTYVQTVLNGIAEESQKQRYDFMVYTNALTDSPERALSDVIDGRSDGIITIAAGKSHGLIDLLAERSVPMITVGAYRRENVPFLIADNESGTKAALEHLAALGHTKIGCLYGDLTSDDGRERLDAYLAFMHSRGIPIDRSWKLGGAFDGERAYTWAKRMLTAGDRPTAILAANDSMAISAIRAAIEQGLSVPEDLSVIGFDNTVACLLSSPTLTSVEQPLESMGSIAVRNLLAILGGEPAPNLLRFSTGLVVRESTASCRCVVSKPVIRS